MSKHDGEKYIVAEISARYGCEKMQNNQGKAISTPLDDDCGMIGERSGAGHGKRACRARYWSVILLSMIIAPMILVLGFSTTAPAAAVGPAPVDLGTSDDFVILAKTAVTTTGTTWVGGDIGISPAAASDMTGFDLVMDSSGEFSTSLLVTGNVYASDYAATTTAKLITAVLDMEDAYTDAAGRTLPDDTELGDGDITSMTIDPGLYKWGTGVLISAAGVTLSGGADDVWIFQIAGDLTVDNDAAVILSGGAQPSNIFWQVGGQATLGTTVVMKGIILSQTAIVLNTGSTLEGRALAQTAVTMQANMVYEPGTTPIPEFSQVLIPLVGMMLVVVIVSKVRNQRK
jgi:hypothetical protein